MLRLVYDKKKKKKGIHMNPEPLSLLDILWNEWEMYWQMYADSRTYIIIEIALDKPLVPKRQPEELARR